MNLAAQKPIFRTEILILKLSAKVLAEEQNFN